MKIEDVPMPEPGVGEVLVRVSGSGINPVDWKIRQGALKDQFPVEFPAIVGSEFSGTIERLGDGVEGFAVGDDVYGLHRGSCGRLPGGQAGDVREGPPRRWTCPTRGGIPLAAMTAWQGLFDVGGLERRADGAHPGGVGRRRHLRGAVRPTGRGRRSTRRPRRAASTSCRSSGADRPIDYEAERFEDVAKDCGRRVRPARRGDRQTVAGLPQAGRHPRVHRARRAGGRGEGAGQASRQRLDDAPRPSSSRRSASSWRT